MSFTAIFVMMKNKSAITSYPVSFLRTNGNQQHIDNGTYLARQKKAFAIQQMHSNVICHVSPSFTRVRTRHTFSKGGFR